MTYRHAAKFATITGALTLLAACGFEERPRSGASAPPPTTERQVFFLEAPCDVNVEGVGMVDIEDDYIPGVVACENGNAPPEALKAQAVQARSFLYYKLFVAGATTIQNSQSDQVYSCTGRLPDGPLQKHIDAANATRGEYLEFEGSIVASFYVAGAIPPNPDPNDPWGSCMPNGGNDPTSTQQWVTYNRGKSGCDIDMTNLGFTPADCRGNPYNRGCASQNGQSCLDEAGVPYTQMFSYFYGDDIELVVAEGQCGDEPFTDEDRSCQENGDVAHCSDASTRIECEDGRATASETCNDGCGEGACLPPTDDTFCTGQPDGMYCDGALRIECAGEAVSVSEACPDGCANGACNAAPANNENNENNGTGGPGNNDDGGNPGGTPDTAGGIPPVIGVSPGVEGGCSTANGSGSTGLVGALFGFALLGLRRRR